MLLYIHGFNSSPQSFKANQTAQYLAENHPEVEFVCPQLPPHAVDALQLLGELFDKNQKVIKGIVGSSLGGYFASYFVEKYSVKSVLVNPAVRPAELFCDYLGEQLNPYTNERYVLTESDLQEIQAVDTPTIKNVDCYWLLQQQGDEVLDYRQAVEKYARCRQTVEAGGDHSFQGFERFLPDIARFFDLSGCA